MGLRFRQTLRLFPGVRLNIGLGGASVSFGGRGATLTVGPRGTYANVGIPGTGLSYRTQLSPPGRTATAARSRASPTEGTSATVPPTSVSQIALRLGEDGTVTVSLVDGGQPNASQMREIWAVHGDAIRSWLEKQADLVNDARTTVANVHYDTPSSDFVPVYTPRTFDTPPPQPPTAPRDEPAPPRPAPPHLGVLSAFSGDARRRHEREKAQHSAAYADALRTWQERRQHARDAYDVACQMHHQALLRWQHARERHVNEEQDKADVFPARIRTHLPTMQESLNDTLMALQWPRETALSYHIDVPDRALMIDVDLPEIEAMPKRIARLSSNGKRILMKELSESALRKFYARHIHGIIMRIGGVSFAALPSLRRCVVSGYSQRLDPATGAVRDDYLLSVRFQRSGFSDIEFSNIEQVDPVRVVENFEHRRKMTKTGIFTPITPFTA